MTAHALTTEARIRHRAFVLRALQEAGRDGLTSRDAADLPYAPASMRARSGHSSYSSAFSMAHSDGVIRRLPEMRVPLAGGAKHGVYVHPAYVDGRETVPFVSNREQWIEKAVRAAYAHIHQPLGGFDSEDEVVAAVLEMLG